MKNLYRAPLIAAQQFILPYQASVDMKGLKIDSYIVSKMAFLIFVVKKSSATFCLINTVIYEIIKWWITVSFSFVCMASLFTSQWDPGISWILVKVQIIIFCFATMSYCGINMQKEKRKYPFKL